jgi:hypothetical protein
MHRLDFDLYKVYIILILKVMPFEPPRALSVDTSQERDNLPCVALAEGPKQIKTEMLAFFKKCVK